MYCFDQPSASSTTFFSMPAIDQLVNYQPQMAQQPSTNPQSHSLPPSLTYQPPPVIFEYTNCASPMVYYEAELDTQMNEIAHSPESSSVFSPNSTSSAGSAYGENLLKPRDLLSMSDHELEKLSIRQLNSVLAFGELDHATIQSIKQRRRTLKNRGYALNCRNRRIRNQHQLETENVALKRRCQKLSGMVDDLRQRLSFYEPQILHHQTPATESSWFEANTGDYQSAKTTTKTRIKIEHSGNATAK